MFFRALKAERMKLRHSPVWLAFLIIPLIPAAMGTFNYMGNLEILQDMWYSLWTQHSLFTCYFFLPSLIGVYCSYLCRLEHMNNNWNSLLTSPVSFSCLYGAKLFTGAIMVLLTHIWIGTLFVASGKLIGIQAPIPVEMLTWLLCGTAGGIVVCTLQLFLSLVIRSFAVPVGIALMGGIGGMLALTEGIGVFFPYALTSIGMRANNPGGAMAVPLHQFVLSCILFLFLFMGLSIVYIKQKDV